MLKQDFSYFGVTNDVTIVTYTTYYDNQNSILNSIPDTNHINHIPTTKYTYLIVKETINESSTKAKPLFRIRFGTNFSREVYSLETSTDAACKYYQLLSIEKERKTRPLKINSRIRPFSELSYSTKRRKMLSLSQHILDIVEAEKENKFHPTDQIELNQIKFKTCNGLYEINFGQLDKMKEIKKIEAVVKSLDKDPFRIPQVWFPNASIPTRKKKKEALIHFLNKNKSYSLALSLSPVIKAGILTKE
ncbi:12956_t:CDS:2, partial [Rhizophagus irregularis]